MALTPVIYQNIGGRQHCAVLSRNDNPVTYYTSHHTSQAAQDIGLFSLKASVSIVSFNNPLARDLRAFMTYICSRYCIKWLQELQNGNKIPRPHGNKFNFSKTLPLRISTDFSFLHEFIQAEWRGLFYHWWFSEKCLKNRPASGRKLGCKGWPVESWTNIA